MHLEASRAGPEKSDCKKKMRLQEIGTIQGGQLFILFGWLVVLD
jgi:hypothetical protein